MTASVERRGADGALGPPELLGAPLPIAARAVQQPLIQAIVDELRGGAGPSPPSAS